MEKRKIATKALIAIAIGALAIALISYSGYKNSNAFKVKAQDPAKYALIMQRIDYAKALLKKDNKNQDALVRLGSAYEELGDDNAAISEYKKAIKIDQAAIIPWTNLAAIYKKQGKFEKAKNAYEQAITFFPKDTQSYNNLVDLYINYNTGTLDEVLNVIQQGIEQTGDAGLKKMQESLKKKNDK